MAIITLIFAGITTLVTIGVIWSLIQKAIPEWIYELKNNWECGDYLNTYWFALLGLVVGIILVGGLGFGSYFLGSCAFHQMGWIESPFFRPIHTSEPPAKRIRYDVDSDIDVHTDFVHEGKVIHQEQL